MSHAQAALRVTREVIGLSPESDATGDARLDVREAGAESRGSDTRERIIEEARALFADKGFDGATIGAIARRVGIAEGTIYRHFESKEDLFISCLMPAVEAFINRHVPEMGKARTVREFIRHSVELHFRFYEEHLDSMNILYAEAPYHPRLMEILGQRIMAGTKALVPSLKAMLSSGGIKNTRNLAAIGVAFDAGVWAIINFGDRFRDLYEKMGLGVDREALIEDMTDQYLYGLIGRPPDAETFRDS